MRRIQYTWLLDPDSYDPDTTHAFKEYLKATGHMLLNYDAPSLVIKDGPAAVNISACPAKCAREGHWEVLPPTFRKYRPILVTAETT